MCSFIHAEMSLRSVQLPLDHLVKMRDRACVISIEMVEKPCACMMGASDVVYVERGGVQEPSPGEPQ